MVEEPVPGARIGFGVKVIVTPDVAVADKVIAELKPFTAVVLMVDVPELPRDTVRLDGFALMLKSGGFGVVTVKATVVVWVIPPPVPVTVML
jgi:hypothetical protein